MSAHKLGIFDGLLDRQIEEIVFELNRRAMAQPEVWQTPTLLNGWAGWAGEDPGYYRDGLGRVHFRARVKSGTYTSGTTLFTLPEGYRPAQNEIVTTYSSNGTVTAACRLYVQTDGQVKIYDANGNSEVGLGGISFRAEQ